MGIEPAFYVDSGPPVFYAFNPCGHIATEKTVKYVVYSLFVVLLKITPCFLCPIVLNFCSGIGPQYQFHMVQQHSIRSVHSVRRHQQATLATSGLYSAERSIVILVSFNYSRVPLSSFIFSTLCNLFLLLLFPPIIPKYHLEYLFSNI